LLSAFGRRSRARRRAAATTATNTEKTECPATATTTSFGFLTPECKYVVFDQPSNTRMVEVVKGNKKCVPGPSAKKLLAIGC
jgi:hypothetical protein